MSVFEELNHWSIRRSLQAQENDPHVYNVIAHKENCSNLTMPSVSRGTVAPRCDQKRYNLGFSKPIISVRKCVIQMSPGQFQYSVSSPLATNTYVTDTSIQRGFKDNTKKLESIKMKINDKRNTDSHF
jgi:hypothetical protein